MTTLHETRLDPTPGRVSRPMRQRQTADLFAEAGLPCTDEHRHDLHEQVVVLNIGVARAVARRFANRGLDVQDLEQVACEALLKAVRRFDPHSDNDFLAFAVPTIRGELQRHFRDRGWMVRPTRRVQETQWRAARVEEDLTAELGRPPVTEEIVRALGVTHEEYAEARSAQGCFSPSSLDQPLSLAVESADLGSTISSTDRDMHASEARVLLVPLVQGLSQRERLVIFLRYFEDLTQAEIGIKIGVGQAQVSRILNSALHGLRTAMGEGEPDAA